MQPQRLARIKSVMQEELSVLISQHLKDPRVSNVSITRIELTPDAGNANVFITVLGAGLVADGDKSIEDPIQDRGETAEIEQCLEGLRSATGFLRREIGKALTLRATPQLTFLADKGLDNSLRVHELLKKIPKSEPKPDGK